MNAIQFLAGIGIFLSIYAYYVERHARRIKNFRTVCDISDNISCTKAVTSKYAKITGVSNALLGIAYYSTVYVLETGGIATILFWVSILGVLASLYLAYISYFKLKNFCVVCSATYLVNIGILLLIIF